MRFGAKKWTFWVKHGGVNGRGVTVFEDFFLYRVGNIIIAMLEVRYVARQGIAHE